MRSERQVSNQEITTEKRGKEKSKEIYEKLDKIISDNKDKEGSLINVLHQTQNISGYLSREILVHIAEGMNIPFAEVYGVVSFYSLFTMKPRGLYTIEVCMGTACYVKGSEEILEGLKNKLKIEPGEVTEDELFSLETTRCKGACSLAPVVAVGDDIYSRVKVDELDEILDNYNKEGAH